MRWGSLWPDGLAWVGIVRFIGNSSHPIGSGHVGKALKVLAETGKEVVPIPLPPFVHILQSYPSDGCISAAPNPDFIFFQSSSPPSLGRESTVISGEDKGRSRNVIFSSFPRLSVFSLGIFFFPSSLSTTDSKEP